MHPKNIINDDVKEFVIRLAGLTPLRKLEKEITATLIIAKERNRLKRWIFRSIKNPTIATTGRSSGDPIHNEARLLPVIPITTRAKAVGLNMCFLLTVSTYFESMAMKPASAIVTKSEKRSPGKRIKNKIRAVIANDSAFIEALKIFESARFDIKVTTRRIASDFIRETVSIELIPKKLKINAVAEIMTRPYKIRRYIVILFRNLSIMLIIRFLVYFMTIFN